jgi:hypothetical protein
MNLENRVGRLESLLLPKPDYRPDLYDAVVQMDMITAGLSKDEAELRLGSRDDFINDRRAD